MNRNTQHQVPDTISPYKRDQVEAYMERLLEPFATAVASSDAELCEHGLLPHAVFDILTSRRYCYLSRSRTAHYKGPVVSSLARDILAGEPLRFYYDLGAGYHASVEPGGELSFDVGLSELCVLSQAVSFCREIERIYRPGVRFFLVIDNICGLMTNDIPLESTEEYCRRLRALIRETGVDCVELLVESEEFSTSDYSLEDAARDEDAAALNPTQDDIENVQRFLGRRCDVDEALERIVRYKRASVLTERMLEQVIRGVRMTQRATDGTLGFRPFPGGDSRTQCGMVAIAENSKGKLRPFLLTSRNIDRFRCIDLDFPDLLPQSVGPITYAENLY